ncbi:MAG: bifunctional UDP-N-acetylglucosamine diphosphorylase/glucosamine-1-phosphate N-acetyltransferase GlmU, partial [Bdellovibrio sp.]|nr:bifunctional UDP-N-acetylglucosamine diphosphorylase/glucosamine-1-phosphate N-acetyltransferase GlmU [Bdellovibrio sp.]
NWKNSDDVCGVNDAWELAHAQRLMNERVVKKWAMQGVQFIDPWSSWIDVNVELSLGVTIHPGVILRGKTKIGPGSVIGPRSVLTDVVVGREVVIKTGTIADASVIGDYCTVGPYAHLRLDNQIETHVKIGNFVELKKTKIGDYTSIAHLSYLGDAEVGKRVNIGCGFVTCNFDGRIIDGERKHKTIIGDDVFMGSDCQTVAPVTVGQGAYVASGSTITENVEPGSLAIARSRQINKIGYAVKKNIEE